MSVSVSNRIETRNVRKSQKFFQKFQQQIELASNTEKSSEKKDTINESSTTVPNNVQQPTQIHTKIPVSQQQTRLSVSHTTNNNTNKNTARPNTTVVSNNTVNKQTTNDTNTNNKRLRLNRSPSNISSITTWSDTSKLKTLKDHSTISKASKSITNLQQLNDDEHVTESASPRKQQDNSKSAKQKPNEKPPNVSSSFPTFNKKTIQQQQQQKPSATSKPTNKTTIKKEQNDQPHQNDVKPILSKSLMSKIENAKHKLAHSEKNKKVTEDDQLSTTTMATDSTVITNTTNTSHVKKTNQIPVYVNSKYTSLIRQKQHNKMQTVSTILE